MILNITTGESGTDFSGGNSRPPQRERLKNRHQNHSGADGGKHRSGGVFRLMPRLLAGLLAVVAVAPGQLRAQTKTAKPAPPSDRCLLIVETSKPMKQRSEAVLGAVRGLLMSGLNGQLRDGSTLGVWTYNEDLYAGRFPLQTWSSSAQKDITQRTLAFLKGQKYEKQANFHKVAPALGRVIKDSELIMVVLISSGDHEVRGTPFDDQINTAVPAVEQPTAESADALCYRLVCQKRPDCQLRCQHASVAAGNAPPAAGDQECRGGGAGEARRGRAQDADIECATPHRFREEAPAGASLDAKAGADDYQAGNAASCARGGQHKRACSGEATRASRTAGRNRKDRTGAGCTRKACDRISPEAQRPHPSRLPNPRQKLYRHPRRSRSDPSPSKSEPAPPPPAPKPKPEPASIEQPTPSPVREVKTEPAPAPPATTAASAETSGNATGIASALSHPSPLPVPPAQTATAVPDGPLASHRTIWIAGLVMAVVAGGFTILLLRRSRAAPRVSLITRSLERKNKP